MNENQIQSRKWLLTINNPLDHGMTHDEIIDRAQKFNPDYFCMADEIGESGTYHTHVFLYSSSPMRFGTVKKRFPTAHIDKATGTSKEIRDYVCKQGKWADTDKAQTSVEGTFKEFGTLPSASQEKSPKMAQLMQDVKDGYSTTEIIENDPSFAFKINDIEALREKLLFERFRKENRPVKTNYLNQLERQQKEREQAGKMWDNQFGLVFTDALGKYLVRRTVVKHFKKISQRAGISDDARFHDLRHSFAVSSLYAGDDIKTVQANLGHATAQFTLDVYGHVTQKMRQESANRMQKFYEQLNSENGL